MKRKSQIVLPFSLMVLLFLTPVCLASDPVALTFDQTDINLGLHLDFLMDPQGRLTLDDVTSKPHLDRFKANTTAYLSIPPGPKAVWIRFSIAPDAAEEEVPGGRILEIGSALLLRVDFYRPGNASPDRYESLAAGKLLSPEREIDFRNCAFRLTPSRDGETVYYVRLQPPGPLLVPIRLWTGDTFRKYVMYDYFRYGLVYGVLFAMALYNLFIYLSLRERIYLIYVLYMLSFLFYFLVFNGQLLILIDLGGGHASVAEWLFLGASIFFSAAFCRLFLNTKIHTPAWDKVMIFFQATALCIMVLGVLRLHETAAVVANITGLVGPINLAVIGVIRHRQGFKPASYYILANLFFILGTMVYISWLMNILSFHAPAELIFTLGPAFESVFLSFALADRIRTLEREKRSLAQRSAKYKLESETDGLTGLFNKRFLIDRLALEAEAADDMGIPLSFIIADVDNFKNYNDTYGHPEGDRVLKSLARVISDSIRRKDSGCRYGGEEFAVILPEIDLDNASRVAERMRSEFASQRFTPSKDLIVSCGVSLGVAQHRLGDPPSEVIRRADAALYQAKKQGKNRVIQAA